MTEDITDLTTNEETNTQPTSTQPISVVNSCSEISGLVGGVLEAYVWRLVYTMGVATRGRTLSEELLVKLL